MLCLIESRASAQLTPHDAQHIDNENKQAGCSRQYKFWVVAAQMLEKWRQIPQCFLSSARAPIYEDFASK